MAASGSARTQARRLFSGLGEIDTRALRNVTGIYCDGVLIGLISQEDVIFLRAEGVVARALAAEGSEPYTVEADGDARQIAYWRLPEDSLDDPEEAMLWANRSLDLARARRRG